MRRAQRHADQRVADEADDPADQAAGRHDRAVARRCSCPALAPAAAPDCRGRTGALGRRSASWPPTTSGRRRPASRRRTRPGSRAWVAPPCGVRAAVEQAAGRRSGVMAVRTQRSTIAGSVMPACRLACPTPVHVRVHVRVPCSDRAGRRSRPTVRSRTATTDTLVVPCLYRTAAAQRGGGAAAGLPRRRRARPPVRRGRPRAAPGRRLGARRAARPARRRPRLLHRRAARSRRSRWSRAGRTRSGRPGASSARSACRSDGLRLEITTFRAEAYDGVTRNPVVRVRHEPARRPAAARLHRSTRWRSALPGSRVHRPVRRARAIWPPRCIRTPGTPAESFGDDPLRMLRAARFAAQAAVRGGRSRSSPR